MYHSPKPASMRCTAAACTAASAAAGGAVMVSIAGGVTASSAALRAESDCAEGTKRIVAPLLAPLRSSPPGWSRKMFLMAAAAADAACCCCCIARMVAAAATAAIWLSPPVAAFCPAPGRTAVGDMVPVAETSDKEEADVADDSVEAADPSKTNLWR